MNTSMALGTLGFGLTRALWWIALLCALAMGHGARAQAPVEIGAAEAMERMAQAITEGRDNLLAVFSRVGLEGEAKRIADGTQSPIHSFSADVVLAGLYRRAEEAQKDEGNRLLALLYHDAAARSAAIRDDPTLRPFGEKYSQAQATATAIQLAPLPAVPDLAARIALPAAVDKAISTLADFHGARGLAAMKAAALRTFRKSGFDAQAFDKALLDAKRPDEALRHLLDRGTPPPSAEIALRQLLLEAGSLSAALGTDRETLRLMDELSREISPQQARYRAEEENLLSRKKQYAESEKQSLRGNVGRSSDSDVLALLRPPGEPPPSIPSPGPEAPRPPDSGLGGHSPSTEDLDKHAQRYEKFDRDTFHTPAGTQQEQTSKTSRKYGVARYSARAARGVAVGAPVRSDVKQVVQTVVWMTHPDDDRFGRLFVTFQGPSAAKPLLAASRPLFTDSFRAAVDVLWKKQPSQAATFRPGEMLVLMSMALNGPVRSATRQQIAELDKEIEAQARFAMSEKDWAELLEWAAVARDKSQTENRREVAQRMVSMTLALNAPEAMVKERERKLEEIRVLRDIVLHPAFAGPEVGWSATRVDFWTNQPDALMKEALLMAPGDSTAPMSALASALRGMATWQYHERASVIQLGAGTRSVRELVVKSLGGVPSTRSHFAITLFSVEKGDKGLKAEDKLYRRPDAEQHVQPMLDWLATRHHDYMRLNDFSEAFSILRWLKSQQIEVTMLGMAAERPRIAAPDRVDIRTGPQLGR